MGIKSENINDFLNKPRMVLLILGVLSAFFIWVAFYFQGTGDVGDSIDHYFFARYAFEHPMNFLNSWAKPVFVFCALPFAQFGFIGIKIFNVLTALFTAWLMFLSLRKMECKLAWLSTVFLFASPLYFILMFSGLTEYLFAFFLVAGIYLFVNKHFWVAVVLLSFLPFVRSEGLLILPCILLYLAVKGKWKIMPAIISGHIFFGILGWIFKGDFLWMFTENAYSSYSNEYGTGNWNHFFIQLNYVIGTPLYFLFGIGFLVYFLGLFFKKFRFVSFLPERYILVLLSFLVFFCAHIIFWKFGMYHSMGLKRVMNCVVPLIILIVIHGLEMIFALSNKYKFPFSKILVILFGLMVLIFPFTGNHAAINVYKDLALQADQKQIIKLVEKLKLQFPAMKQNMIYCSHPYIHLLLDMDPFDHNHIRSVGSFPSITIMGDSDLIIWDCSFAEHEDGVALELLENNKRLSLWMAWPQTDMEKCYFVFVKNK
jgi:hypothetical protein